MTTHNETTRRTETAALAALFAAASVAAGEPAPPVVDTSSGRDPSVTLVPHYPPLARRQRIEGEAVVCFKIAPDGRILEPYVASSTHELFEEPALQAIKGSRFEPLEPGEEVTPTVCRTYRFRLDPATES